MLSREVFELETNKFCELFEASLPAKQVVFAHAIPTRFLVSKETVIRKEKKGSVASVPLEVGLRTIRNMTKYLWIVFRMFLVETKLIGQS